MKLTVSSESVRHTRYRPHPAASFRTNFMGADLRQMQPADERPTTGVIYPMAYLIEQDAHQELRPHFHNANQFQIFVAGGGCLGRHTVEIGSGHFAAPYSPYGPIIGDDRGVAYMTLRNSWDNGAQYMPESREKLRAAQQSSRQAVFGPVRNLDAAQLAAQHEKSSETLLAPEADGLGAWLHRLPPGGQMTGPPPSEGGGQFWVVLNGTLTEGGAQMPRLSCIFLSPDEQPFAGGAGPDGVELLALQYPLFQAV